MDARQTHARELVIFDCDGVLVDSEPIRARVFAHMLAEHGVPLGAAEAQRLFRGQRLARCVDHVERTFLCTLPGDFLDRYRAAIMAEFERSLRSVPGVRAALEAIDAPVCVASSSPRPYVDAVLALTRLQSFFGDNVFSAYELQTWKPSPGLFLHAAAVFATAPERCTVVEDSVVGVQAGIRAGMRVLAYGRGDYLDALAREGGRAFSDMRRLPALLSAV